MGEPGVWQGLADAVWLLVWGPVFWWTVFTAHIDYLI